MDVRVLEIPDVLVITPKRFSDERGFFSEVFNAAAFAAVVPEVVFVQDNHSFSTERGVIRGLHFQTQPHAQGKLVRCTRGRILDVVVDIRRASPTYGRYVSAELSAENWAQLWAPVGFAHGFCTLEPNCEVQYKVTDLYAPECDRAIAFDDPDIAIPWPLPESGAIVSERDRRAPRLKEIKSIGF